MEKKNFLDDRGAGILMPISSLASPYGIGTLGEEAYHFVDRLVKAGQKYWQVLPAGPTSFGDSPYQSFSAFAGNPYFIDLDTLIEEGLLLKDEVTCESWGDDPEDVDYAILFQNRFRVLKKAYKRSRHKEQSSYRTFCRQNAYWLADYCLYMALKFENDNKEWQLWEEDIRFRKKAAVKLWEKKLADEIGFWEFCQYKFYEQWKRLKKYAHKKKIRLIGDIPLYVSMDSADVWANPGQYQLDETLHPVDVAGCPPDAFSDYGQKWGNPIYDWKVMEKDHFRWWKKRIRAAGSMYDVVRIDHFIGIVRYYAIPADGVPVDGAFCEGPGAKLIEAIDESIGDAKVIAEDLGVVVPGVRKLLEQSGYPGMKILEFAFDGNKENEYLPHNYERNCVVYSGTHDNETLLGYFDSLPEKGYTYLQDYTGVKKREELADAVIRLAYQSVADTVILQMQDILKKDNDARMNLPSTIGQNWRWRLKKEEFGEKQIAFLANLADIYHR